MRLKALMLRVKAALAGNRETAADDSAGEAARAASEIEDLIASLRAQPPDERRGANVSLTDPGTADAFVPSLLAATRDEDPYIRASAIHALGHYDMETHAQAAQAVIRALAGDPDASIRAAAAAALASQSPKHVHALVKAALGDASAEVRTQAVLALGVFRTEPAVEALKDRLGHDQDAEVRAFAASMLGELRRADLIPDLRVAVNDSDEGVRATVLSALRECAGFEVGPALCNVLLAALSDTSAIVRETAAEALRFSSPEAIPALMVAANDEVARVRLQAVIALGSMQVHQAIDTLANRVFSDPDEEVRYYAVNALGEMRHAGATQHLIDALNKPAETRRVRWAALWALGDNNDFDALPALHAALQDPDAEFRERAADSLGSLPWEAHPDPTATLQSLCRALSDAEPNVRRSVCDALASLRDARAVPFLAGALGDGDDEVRCKIIEAISRIDAKRHAALILGCLQDPSRRVQQCAAEALWLPDGAVTPPEALAFLRAPDADAQVKGALAKSLTRHGNPAAIAHLIDALATAQADARAGLVEALREQPDPRAVAPLLGLLSDDEDAVRGEAALALAAIGDDEAVPPLASRLKREPSPEVRRRAVWALSFFTPGKVLPLLTASFGDSDPHVRQQAVQALAEICDVSELRDLLSALPKRREDVRQALEEAIEALENDPMPDEGGRSRRVGIGTVHYV
ncbi:HEAT repeat domain-containing protein [Cupriavidus basilensis]|uniref:HEAT repeat domain-containing protein n=1 Tax=Cupriavidus basilensis TaxID=68895 RepID=A0A643FZL3_9BURK|nr:HEAT repeat domain-containing protein [Cupriavidus basilensis]QOT81166.1 HEAT repeat domain-containing protein [Cupriavidus basilensis]